MVVRQALYRQTKRLIAASDSARLDCELIMAHALQTERSNLWRYLDKQLTSRQLKKIDLLIKQRQKHVPIAYLIGQQEFYGLSLRVTPAVLIPRPATELLVDHIIQRWPKNSTLKIIDVGTGSGAIALALAKHFPRAKIFATDISPAALSVARANARRLKLSPRITWLRGSVLKPLRPGHSQVIVANLPYLRSAQLNEPSIKFEPPIALAGGQTGLDWIKKLLDQLSDWSVDEVVLEIDPRQAQTVTAWLHRRWPNGRLAKLSDGRTIRGLTWRPG